MCFAILLIVNSAGDAVDDAGITLREALTLAQHDDVHITFAPSLAGATISIASPLPAISRAGLVLEGLAGNDGAPAVTLSGASLRVTASNVRIEGLTFRDSTNGSPAISVTTGSTSKSVVRNVTIARNRFLQFDGPAIDVQSSADGGTIDDVLVDSNELDHTGGVTDRGSGVLVGTGNHGVGSFVTRVVIARNELAGMDGERNAIAVGAAGALATIEDTLIYGNEFRTSTYPIEATSSGRQGRTTRTSIIANRFTANIHPIIFTSIGIDETHRATDNRAADILISSNVFLDNLGEGMLLQGGWKEISSGNRIENARIVNNVFARNAFAAVVLNGGGGGAEDNTIDGVTIANNTIVQTQSNGMVINASLSPSSRNTIRGVRVVNTIVSANPGVPFLGDPPQEVRATIVEDDPRFADPGRDDYSLLPGSPSLNSGASDTAPLTDSRCRARVGSPDLGALEYNATPRVRLLQLNRGSGSGDVQFTGGGVVCDSIRNGRLEGFLPGATVVMTAIPAAGSVFKSWGGDADCLDGTLTPTADTLCTATFEKSSRRRAVRR